ncbi:C-terminal autoproteolytic domain of nucleoporin nup98 [Fistulina hepatica ATCC 64428]|uniref:C-terminal autoproteolytic domain of nucleoporin nup98 n=1 Tax=Fistulina hepatica ATCC 64428 TaxID=1128425 RepID=A0A0D6ZYL5_9AGAR|nr:C-terminal autoproteolytic domain of nucleoporin nup98 [Fistulina hepatica ATCC 64428]KIY42884.1 C-terminal autoproteolytic domain of nucleoporin nup98 [Fistulina hepatica ATCC 64428]
MFGSTNVAQPLGASTTQLGNSLFGTSMLGPATNMLSATASNSGAQGTLTASIMQPIGSNLPIFQMLPPGPRSVDIEQPKSKNTYFIDVPTRTPLPRANLTYNSSPSKLRGFTSMSSSIAAGALTTNKNRANALSLSRSVDPRASVGPDSFLSGSSSAALGSGNGRNGVKKLILDKKVDPAQFFRSGASPQSKMFTPSLVQSIRERDVANEKKTKAPPPAPPEPPQNRFGAPDGVLDGEEDNLQHGQYYCKPPLEKLKRLSYQELSAVPDLIVGRVGYGYVQFLEPVDLTTLDELRQILGKIVLFEERECTVYPSGEMDKPPPGSGLNVPARVTLYGCWPLDKATRSPIKDPNDPKVKRYIKRLRETPFTSFESYDIEEGKWVFMAETL